MNKFTAVVMSTLLMNAASDCAELEVIKDAVCFEVHRPLRQREEYHCMRYYSHAYGNSAIAQHSCPADGKMLQFFDQKNRMISQQGLGPLDALGRMDEHESVFRKCLGSKPLVSHAKLYEFGIPVHVGLYDKYNYLIAMSQEQVKDLTIISDALKQEFSPFVGNPEALERMAIAPLSAHAKATTISLKHATLAAVVVMGCYVIYKKLRAQKQEKQEKPA